MSNSDWAEGFRQRLNLLHRGFGHSKAEMARKCGLPPRSLENYFKGQKPGVDALLAIARGMEVDVDWLIGEAPEDGTLSLKIVSEATIHVLYPFLSELVSETTQGRKPVHGGKILGSELLPVVLDLETKIRAEYVRLRRLYGQDILTAGDLIYRPNPPNDTRDD